MSPGLAIGSQGPFDALERRLSLSTVVAKLPPYDDDDEDLPPEEDPGDFPGEDPPVVYPPLPPSGPVGPG